MTRETAATVTIVQAHVRLDDPHNCTDDKNVLSMLHAVYETLVWHDGTHIHPHLSTSWTVSDDARHWRFTLREDVQFHDGTPCDAEAVVQSLQRMARPDKGYTLGAPGVWSQYLGGATIHADDPHTVRIALAAPMADLLDVLVQGFIAAPAMLSQLDSGASALPCGTGPYRVVSVEDGAVRAARMPGHPRSGGPDYVTWRAEPDEDERLAAVRAGQAQVATGLTAQSAAAIPGVTQVTYENPVAIIFLLNSARGPLTDPRLRLALNLAIDRDAMVAVARSGAGKPLHAVMPAQSLGAAGSPELAHDMDRAGRLMAEVGVSVGLKLTLDCPTRLPDEAEVLTEELRRQVAPLGITLQVRRHDDREAYAHRVRRKEIGDMCVFDSSPLSTFRVLYEKIDSRVAGSWWQGYRNPEVETLLDGAKICVDRNERGGLYGRILRLLQEDPPWLTLYTPLQAVALAGVQPDFQIAPNAVLDVTTLPDFK